MESVTDPYVEISEELWLALNENSVRNEFINESDIVYDKIYTINDFDLFQEVPAIDIDVHPTALELAIEELQAGLQEAKIDYSNQDAVVLAEAQKAIAKAIEEVKADSSNKDAVVLAEIQNQLNSELITIEDIDNICGSNIVAASEVTF